MVANLLFIFLQASSDLAKSQLSFWDKMSDKLVDGLVAVPLLLLVLWGVKKLFEKFFDIFIKNITDTREEYQATLKVKEDQVMSIITSKEAIVKTIADSFKEISNSIVTEHTKQIQMMIDDCRIGTNRNLDTIEKKDVEISSSYNKNILSMEKLQSITQSFLDEQRRHQEVEKDNFGKMMLEMEQRISKKLDKM